MATVTWDLTALLSPDPTNSAPCYWGPASLLNTNDQHDGIQHLFFPNGSAKTTASLAIRVAENYVDTLKFIVRWKSTTTSGDVVWDVDYNSVAVGETADPSGYQRSITVTDTVAGTTNLESECDLTGTDADLAVGDRLQISLSRDLADGADTMSGTAELLGFYMQFSDV